jgi:crotonobetainyl-CoA:carnitine CoA-transferase CaiB-like acyl-CoA transferase
MTLPLEGVLVVSIEQAVAAPLVTRRLADAGARVIKVERPGGDFARSYDAVVHGESAYFVWLNRGKESIVLDFKAPEDAALLERLVARADVFVQNLSPGAAARSGFGSDALRERHPRLVTCDVSGYGESGAYTSMRAYDALVQGEVGLISVTGTPDEPARVGISISDMAAGLHAHTAVLEALLLRERTGRGSGLHVSLFHSMADWMSVPYLHFAYGGSAPPRSGLSHATIAPYGFFTTNDGVRIQLTVQNAREWHRFCANVLRRPEVECDERFTTNPLRVRHRGELDAVIVEVFAACSAEEMAERLGSAGIAFGRLSSMADLAAHPALRLSRVETPTGPVDLPAEAVMWRDEMDGQGATVPALGAHTQSIRREFDGSD